MVSSFNEFCKEHNYKVPLSKKYFDYYTNLGYICIVVQNFLGHYSLVTRKMWYNDISVLTIAELKFIIENFNNKKVFPFSKVDKYINELRTSKR